MFSFHGKRTLKYLSFGLIFIMVLSMVALATETTSEEHVFIDADETIKGPGFYAGDTVQIDGIIDGITFVAGREVRINGEIKGDLFAAAQEIIIDGKINGNLFSAGENIVINGKVKGDVFGAAKEINITKEAVNYRDVFVAGSKIVHTGKIDRQLFAAAQDMNIHGSIDDDVKLDVENLKIHDSAVIKGNVAYSSSNQGSISPNAQVTGKIDWNEITPDEEATGEGQNKFTPMLISLAGALLLWLIITFWRPQFWIRTSEVILGQSLKTIGVGFLVLLVTPILAILLMITVIGIPLGIILSLIYGVSIYLTKIIVAVALGYGIAKKFSWPEKHKGVWLVLLGLVILTLLSNLPFIGFIVKLVTIVLGLGSLLLTYAKPVSQN